MKRQAIVAGQFYPGSGEKLRSVVRELLSRGEKEQERRSLLAMVPHAGYVYSGAVAARTLKRSGLEKTVLLLGPNHTGQGDPMAVWPSGEWEIPGGGLEVEAELAQALITGCGALSADTAAHLREHSLEVILPFLHALAPETRIVPICVAERRPEVLKKTGQDIAAVVKSWSEPVTLVVSSDMSHYVTHDQAKARDALAIEAILNLDPEGLFEVVRRQNITMCGVLPMTVGLSAARDLGATQAELVQYSTSGDVSGDYAQVVGYAGVVVR